MGATRRTWSSSLWTRGTKTYSRTCKKVVTWPYSGKNIHEGIFIQYDEDFDHIVTSAQYVSL